MKAHYLASIAGVTLAATFALPAQAQMFERDRNTAVRERPQPEFDAIGVDLGGFRLFPEAVAGIELNDDIFANDANKVDDVVVRVEPRARIVSEWNNHELILDGSLDSRRFSDNDDESATDVRLRADGRLDVTRATKVFGRAGYAALNEPRTSSSAPAAADAPIEYDISEVGLTGSHEFNRLRVQASIDTAEFDFDNATSNVGGPILQDDRDHVATRYAARAAYAISPDTAVFTEFSHNVRDYDTPNAGGDLRSSHGERLLVGAEFDISQRLRGEAAVGFLQQRYSDAAFEDVDGLAASAQVEWFLSPLTTVTFDGSRQVVETGVDGSSSVLETAVGVRVDHEVYRNFLVSGAVSVAKDEVETVDREDDRLAASIEGMYLLSRNVGVGARYGYQSRQSSGAARGTEFDQNTVGVRLLVRY